MPARRRPLPSLPSPCETRASETLQNVFVFLLSFCLFLFFFPYFCLFLFFPSPCETRVSETLQTVFVFSLSFCAFLFFVFSFFSPVPVKQCKLFCLLIVFLSVCLFLFCLPIPCEPPMESETLQAEFCLFISVLMSFCLLAFLPFVPSPSSTTVKHCEQYQDGYLGIFYHLPNKEKSLKMPIIRSFKLPERKKKSFQYHNQTTLWSNRKKNGKKGTYPRCRNVLPKSIKLQIKCES